MAGKVNRKPTKEEIRDKFMDIETWAHRARHINEVVLPDNDKLKSCIKYIRNDLLDLEIMLGVED